jgi:transcriptional regulator with XRE-family HTH domain
MSHLAITISKLLKEHNLTSADLARRSELHGSLVSRWKGGQQVNIRFEMLEKLASGFSSNPQDHAKLLHAHLKDGCNGPGARFIKLELDTDHPQDPLCRKVLPPVIQEDLDLVSSVAVNNREVRGLLHNLALLIRK